MNTKLKLPIARTIDSKYCPKQTSVCRLASRHLASVTAMNMGLRDG